MRGTLRLFESIAFPDIINLKYFEGIISYIENDSIGQYLTGFSQLREMKGHISLYLNFVSENHAFQNLVTVDTIGIQSNNIYKWGRNLHNLGFNNLIRTQSIDIHGISYTGEMYGFENLEDIKQVFSFSYNNFSKLNGFRRLKNIGRLFAPPGSGNAKAMVFDLFYNKNLEDLSNFDSLRLYPSQISYVVIAHSPKLSVCHVPFICRYIKERTGGDFKIGGNGPGCNSLEEVKSGCLSGTDDDVPLSAAQLTLYPNPTDEVIYFPDTEHSAKVRIYDITGRLRSETQGPEADVSRLPPGLYTVTAEQSGSVKKGRFVKR